MLSSQQRDVLGYGWAGQGSLHLGLSVIDPLVLQVGASHWLFPDDAGWGKATLIGGGLRLEPRVGSRTRLSIEGNGGLGLTGPYNRFMFDAALALEAQASSAVGVGPILRYGQLVTQSGDVRADARFISLGLLVTLRSAPRRPMSAPPASRPPTPEDSDGDGIIDADDRCPREPQGVTPDPARPGCPRLDGDHDGIFDSDDKCPTTPAGPKPDPERPGCPDGDDDNDGVPNHEDKCPTQHQGINPDPARPGCPLPDRDNDSVPDAVDACPDQAGAPQPDPKKNGCPGLVRVEQDQIVILRPVYFATRKDLILAGSFPVLKAVAEALRAIPDIHLVSIEGHTDSQGADDFNMDLSQRRANNVLKFIVEQGIAPERLKATGFGETKPVAPNTSARGRAKNRRVEFKIVDPAPTRGAP